MGVQAGHTQLRCVIWLYKVPGLSLSLRSSRVPKCEGTIICVCCYRNKTTLIKTGNVAELPLEEIIKRLVHYLDWQSISNVFLIIFKFLSARDARSARYLRPLSRVAISHQLAVRTHWKQHVTLYLTHQSGDIKARACFSVQGAATLGLFKLAVGWWDSAFLMEFLTRKFGYPSTTGTRRKVCERPGPEVRFPCRISQPLDELLLCPWLNL